MSSYRFCRTDDIPLLAATFERCRGSDFPEDEPLTVERFKEGVRRVGLWASSSMLALVDDEPVAVLLGAKREDANLVHRIAVHPEHRRHGHGLHLVHSLIRKAAILGPPRLEAEVPGDRLDACAFFEASGLRPEARYVDLVLDRPPGEAPPRGLAIPVTLDDLVQSGAFEPTRARAWIRRLPQLRALGGELHGLALASDVRVEAFVLHRHDPVTSTIDVLGLGVTDPETGDPLLRALLASLYEGRTRMLRIPLFSESEAPIASLEKLGFRAERATVGYVADGREQT